MKQEYQDDCPGYLSDFLIYLKVVKDRTERTEEAYYIDLRTFLRYLLVKNRAASVSKPEDLKKLKIAEVPFEYIERFSLMDAYIYLKWLSEFLDNSSKTRARKTSALKQFYSYLHNKAKLLDDDPLDQLELPKSPRSLPKYLTLDEAQALLASIDSDHYERDYCIITLFLNCGMRLSELWGLNIGDISFENGTLRLFGKGRKERIVYLNPACVDALKDHLDIREAVQTTEKALFLSNRKTRLSRRRVQEIVETSLKQAGLSNLGISTHKLRHTAATLMYQYGDVDTMVLKDILGHESIATTEIYTHLSSNDLKKAADANPLSGQKSAGRRGRNKTSEE